MNDEQIHETITKLVDAEHHLRSQGTHTDEQRAELRRLEESLDQCWDLLRQRRAREEFGEDPDEVKPRDPEAVEDYLQ